MENWDDSKQRGGNTKSCTGQLYITNQDEYHKTVITVKVRRVSTAY